MAAGQLKVQAEARVEDLAAAVERVELEAERPSRLPREAEAEVLPNHLLRVNPACRAMCRSIQPTTRTGIWWISAIRRIRFC